MSKTSHNLGARLERLRLRRRWSYTRLAAEVFAVTGGLWSEATWRRTCLGQTTPERTLLDAMRRFLRSRRARLDETPATAQELSR